MKRISAAPQGAAWAAGVFGAATVAGWAAETVLIPVVPSAPTGFAAVPPAMPGGLAGTLLNGVTLSTSLSGTYDSNVTQSPGGSVAPVQDDFILRIGGGVAYLSKSSDWTFGGSYRGGYNEYFNLADLSGFDQSGDLVLNYQGGRLSAALTTGISFDRGGNRYYSSSFVEQTSIRTALSARYRVSPKTTLQGNLGQSFTTSSGNYADTSSFDLGISALWRYSKLTEFGPGVRYTYQEGGGSNGRSSIGPDLSLNYRLSTKVALTSRVGVDFTRYDEGGGGDPSLSTSVGLNYEASRLWGMNFTLFRDSRADPSVPGAFTQVTAVRLGHHRKIRRVLWNLGLGYETNTNESGGAAVAQRADRDYFTADTSLGMTVFGNTTQASVFLRYNDQSGNSLDSWDATQLGFSLSRNF